MPIVFLLCITSVPLSLRLGRRADNFLLVDGFQWEIEHLWFRAEENVENYIFSQQVPTCVELSTFPNCVVDGVLVCTRTRQFRGLFACLLTAPCRNLFNLYMFFAVREQITLRIGFCGAKSQLSFFAELAAQDQEEREATKIELNMRDYN